MGKHVSHCRFEIRKSASVQVLRISAMHGMTGIDIKHENCVKSIGYYYGHLGNCEGSPVEELRNVQRGGKPNRPESGRPLYTYS